MRVKKYFQTIFLIAMSLALLNGCYPCIDTFDPTPSEFFDRNEFVVTAEFVSLDTLSNLDTVNHLGEERHFYIMEYVFRLIERIKINSNDTLVFLWFLGRTDLEDNYSSVLKLKDSSLLLVYGNEIKTSKDIVGICKPFIGYEFGRVKKMIEGAETNIEFKWNSFETDSVIADMIYNSTALDTVLESRVAKGTVIYGTDDYVTFGTFQEGLMLYCDKGELFADFVSSNTYLKELRKLSKKF